MAACPTVSFGSWQSVLRPKVSCSYGLMTRFLLLLVACSSASFIQSATVQTAAVALRDFNLRSEAEDHILIIRVKGRAPHNCRAGVSQQQQQPRRAFPAAGVKVAVICKVLGVNGGSSQKLIAEKMLGERGEFLIEFSAPLNDAEYLRGSLPGLCSVQLLMSYDPKTRDHSTLATSSTTFASSCLLPAKSPTGSMLEFTAGKFFRQGSAFSSLISSDRVTLPLLSSYRRLLEQKGATSTDSLALGPPDPPQPADPDNITAAKKALSSRPPPPH